MRVTQSFPQKFPKGLPYGFFQCSFEFLLSYLFTLLISADRLHFFRQPMILAPFVFHKGTLQQELPSRVQCSFLLSLLPFCAFCLNEEDAKTCLLQDPQYTVDLILTLPTLLIAAKIANQSCRRLQLAAENKTRDNFLLLKRRNKKPDKKSVN